MSDVPESTAVLLERTAQILRHVEKRLEEHDGRLESVEKMIGKTDPKDPGLSVRVLRIEEQIAAAGRTLSWIGGGGLVGLVGTLIFLWRILRLLAEAPI